MAGRNSSDAKVGDDANMDDDASDAPSTTAETKSAGRNKDYSQTRGFKTRLSKLYQTVQQGFVDKNERNECTQRYWRVYNCELTTNQAYAGTSQIFLPIVHDAIEARVQRFVNTLFPESGRYTELVSSPRDYPHGIMGLMDHYVRRASLRSKTRSLIRNGEVEGQMSLYVDWCDTERYITKKVEKHPEIEPGIHDPSDTFMDVEDEKITSGFPNVRIIMDSNLCVLPATTDDIENEPDVIVALKHYYSDEGLVQAGKDGLFSKDMVAKVRAQKPQANDPSNARDIKKQLTESAGVRLVAGRREYVLFEVWTKMTIEKQRRWTRSFFGGDDMCLGLTVNPNWNDRCPILSKARQRIDGSFWGKSPVDAVEQLQYMANDFVNMAQDSAQYSVLPIVMTDPEKNPQFASMVMANAAIWQTNPNDTKFVEFPQLWKEAIQIVGEARSQIMQAFGLNPAMISMGAGGGKNTQADVAQQSMVAMASVTDEVLTLEDDIYTPLLQMFFELDQQFRDDELVVKVYGQDGIAAKMEKVPPFAWDDRYEFAWRGSQVIRSQQQNQQMIAGLNILGSLPPVLPNGKKIDITPIIETVVENLYGPRLGARIIVDGRDQLSVDPQLENQIMAGDMVAEVHAMDEDQQHIQAHMQAMQTTGDANGQLRVHIMKHQAQMMQKTQQQQAQLAGPGGPPGSRPGAQPAMPRGGQNPAGAIHRDQMQDATQMPRHAG
jgi:hypothetical protein